MSLMFTKVCVICNPSQNIDNNIDHINNKRLFLFLTNLLLFRKILTALYLSLTKTKAGTDYIKLQRPQNMLLNWPMSDLLKLKTIHKFLCPNKRQILVIRFTALRGVRAHENVDHSQRRENVIYRDCVCVM